MRARVEPGPVRFTLGVCFLLYAVDSARESVSFGRRLCLCARDRATKHINTVVEAACVASAKSSLIVQSNQVCPAKYQAITHDNDPASASRPQLTLFRVVVQEWHRKCSSREGIRKAQPPVNFRRGRRCPRRLDGHLVPI